MSLSCLYVSSSRISSVWAKDSGCSAASAAAFSVSSRLLILNGLERTELGGGAEILHTLDFDMAPVIEVGFHAVCLRQSTVSVSVF